MKCQIMGCDKQAIINDDEDDDSLCLCMDHQGIELVHYIEAPEIDTDPQDAKSIERRKNAVAAYKLEMKLYADV
ncbi:MAG: hypothetical protein KGH65_03750 [Candidatus Micrarchaeota archaeon]|nr:hypothetical protein [Candidatus Micrarchaeota archaeon]